MLCRLFTLKNCHVHAHTHTLKSCIETPNGEQRGRKQHCKPVSTLIMHKMNRNLFICGEINTRGINAKYNNYSTCICIRFLRANIGNAKV